MHLGAERTGVLHICLSEVPLVTSGLKAAVRRQQAAGTYPYAQRAHQPYRQRLGRTQRRLSPNCTQTDMQDGVRMADQMRDVLNRYPCSRQQRDELWQPS
jgi:hypothetical protein